MRREVVGEPPMVNSDSNGGGPLGTQSGLLELGKREALAELLPHIISEGLTTNNRSKPAEGSGVHRCGLCLSVGKSPCFTAGLVEPSADADSHPVLPEMDVCKCVVMSNHCLVISFKILSRII